MALKKNKSNDVPDIIWPISSIKCAKMVYILVDL